MITNCVRKLGSVTTPPFLQNRRFRSKSALEALSKASEERVPNIVLYNYPSFAGAFSALFAHLFHSHLNLPCLILPFSAVEPLRVEDLYTEGLERCYFLDFLGPRGFARELSRRSMCQVLSFDHRKSATSKIDSAEDCLENTTFHIDLEKCSATTAYEYFSQKLAEMNLPISGGSVLSLLNSQDRDRLEMVLKYIEDTALQKWSLADTKAFLTGISDWRSKLNCITNPYMYEQLLELNAVDLIARGNSCISSRRFFANKLMDKLFKVRLGRGFYGECLAFRAEGHADLSNEIGELLSIRSAAAGLRPIGAVIYMQRNKIKICLRSTDSDIDTSEVAKAYGGGGFPKSSSVVITMAEYNRWLSVNNTS